MGLLDQDPKAILIYTGEIMREKRNVTMKTFVDHDISTKSNIQTNRKAMQPINYYAHCIHYEKNLPQISQILRKPSIQQSNTLCQPSDPNKQEADRVADQLMNISEPREKEEEPVPNKLIEGAGINRQVEMLEDDNDAVIKAKGMGQTSTPEHSDLAANLQSLKGQGQPLPEETRAFFEPRFGANFSHVRVYTDRKANETAKRLNARAFTHGNDIVFSQGNYTPSATQGKVLLAHELVHVIQQNERQFHSPNVIQCWGMGIHRELTENGVRKLLKVANFENFEIDDRILKILSRNSASMDLRFKELWFNIVAKIKENSLSASTKEGKLKILQQYYDNNPEHARNHGEGGLYSMPKSAAMIKNIKYQYEKYEKEAHQLFTAKHRITYIDKYHRKVFNSFEREKILGFLGDALHVGQDRGAHGEGAEGEGHGGQIFTGKNPDDPGSNPYGYFEAQKNTELILTNALDILYVLLNKKTLKS